MRLDVASDALLRRVAFHWVPFRFYRTCPKSHVFRSMSDRNRPTKDPTSACRVFALSRIGRNARKSNKILRPPPCRASPDLAPPCRNTSVAPLFVHVTIVLAELRANRTRPKSWSRHNSRRHWRVSWAASWNNERLQTNARRARFQSMLARETWRDEVGRRPSGAPAAPCPRLWLGARPCGVAARKRALVGRHGGWA